MIKTIYPDGTTLERRNATDVEIFPDHCQLWGEDEHGLAKPQGRAWRTFSGSSDPGNTKQALLPQGMGATQQAN